MNALLSRLERRFGKYAIDHFALFIVGGMVAVFVLWMLRPSFLGLLTLDLHAVRQGQVWRLFTYLFIPRSDSRFWIILSIYVTWLIGSYLEAAWGSFKFNIFYLLGMIGTTVAAAITGGSEGNVWINASLVFAFATMFPDQEFYIFFVIPVKAKWIGIFSAALWGVAFCIGNWVTRAGIVAAFANYILFFSDYWWDYLKTREATAKRAEERISLRPPPPSASSIGFRICAICGVREQDGADIRVCSCEKCNGPRHLCLEHARNH